MATYWAYTSTVSSLKNDVELELKSFIFENLMKNYLPHISGTNSDDPFIKRLIDVTLTTNPKIYNLLFYRFFI
jgi:hypothetical protein